ncbi:hypothetical protein [Hymenobacter psoromatis]|uniref:hypothetical protein n=1 Tax=Hymenobacter psoromatis TaxID=1484116 RepID=UPI001CBEC43D|nr:hypothetical protein [Hymenobacter psoromatis]
MKTDPITEISIDAAARLCIKPATQKFHMIWREGAEVHWDEKGHFLFSPKPREWSYLDWYQHIIWVAEGYGNGVRLYVTIATRWIDVPNELKQQIIKMSF